MQTIPPIKTYTLRSGKPALTNNGEKETGEKENVKPAKKIARVKNPVVLPDLQDNTHDSGETPSKSPAEVAKSRKRTLKNVSDSNVKPDHTEEVVQSKRKKIVKVVNEPEQKEEVVEMKQRKGVKVVSDSSTTTEPVKQASVPNVSRKKKVTTKAISPKVETDDAEVVSKKIKGGVQTPQRTYVGGAVPGKTVRKNKKPTLVPSAVVATTSKLEVSDNDNNDDDMEAEETAYRQQLAEKQKEASKKRGKKVVKIKKELPEGSDIYCSKCNEVFDTAQELEAHEKSCFKGKRYPCSHPGCDHVNSQKSLLREHVKGVHENNPFRCELCLDEVFIYKKSLQKHEKHYHGEPGKVQFKYACEQCEFFSDDKTEYQTHVDRHTNTKRFKCNVCSMTFFTQSQLTNHLKNSCSSTVGMDKYECSVCGKRLKTEDRYREHFYGQHVLNQPQKMYYCEVCISRFFSEKGLEVHGCKGGSVFKNP